MGAVKPVTDSSFEADVLTSDKPVLVDFWAEWCGPCRMIGPVVEELATQMEATISVAKINIDENPLTPTKYGIRSIPTLMLFKGGQLVSTKVGAVPKQTLENWIKEQV